MDRIGELTEAVAIGAALPSENDDFLISALSAQGSEAEPAAVQAAPVGMGRPAAAQSVPRTIRLPLSLIDQLMNGVSDM
ncbi:hypothetical protein LTR94_037362, partial [Friedmanniomyces endolithicus]